MKISKIVLMITSECNLGCSYCYSRGTIKQDKSKVKSTLIQVLEKNPDIKFITVTGGEPLIEFDFLMELRSIIPDKIAMGIISSSKLLTPSRIEKLKNKNMQIKVSVDGTSGFEIKRLDHRIHELIRNNGWLFSGISKVISKLNYKTTYEDYMSLIDTGIKEIELIPELYVRWEDEEIEYIVRQLEMIFQKMQEIENTPRLLLLKDSGNRYMNCEKIQILPDGDLALCSSTSISGKNIYLKQEKMEKFDTFKKLLITNAIKDLKEQNILNDDTKNLFCMVDYYYYEKIRGTKSDNLVKLKSGVKLFTAIRDVMRKYERPVLYNQIRRKMQ